MAQELANSQSPSPITLRVDGAADVLRSGECAKAFSCSLGFPPEHGEEIALVVSELATNLLRHASGGSIGFSAIQDAARTGIRIESADAGPGIQDIEQAMTDGYSTAGGLGLGLGTINRLMDELDIHSGPRDGVHVVCQRWIRPRAAGIFPTPVSFGAATRSRRSYEENGDTFLIKQWDGNALAGVIDGLGHGPLAQRASQTARHYIEQHFDQPLDNLFRGVGRACRSTRGVVMALARFDFKTQKLMVASVGNIEMRLFGGSERFSPMVRRGIVGLNAPDPVCTEHPWTSTCLMIMHSDGLSTQWDWNDYRELAASPPDAIAQRLLKTLAKPDDDATVVVARSARP